ncbi:hypothetical protein BSZ19_19260 [Bradyrhizobium japonicum]|uniref:Uncharacterized protein n=1 Tax=Bradyrhizobium japonicum TaxID=375 RepID=A0A1Y2JNI4_BRAJP|nr:hypothetical protein BSZ19_19260 [Bradyrhizobium japonicum]
MANERRRNVYAAQILVDGSPVRCKVRHLTESSAIVQIDNAPFVLSACVFQALAWILIARLYGVISAV